jgi:hypothetical protein
VPRATLYWVLLPQHVYAGPRATQFTVYYWFMCRLGQHTLLDIVVSLCGVLLLAIMLRLGQYSLLGIVVGYARFRATHFTGHH